MSKGKGISKKNFKKLLTYLKEVKEKEEVEKVKKPLKKK